MKRSHCVALLALAGSHLVSGCALSYSNGNQRNIVGFVWIQYVPRKDAPAHEPNPAGLESELSHASAIRQRTLGVYVDATLPHPGAGIGFRDTLVVTPAADAETSLEYHPSQPLSARLIVRPAANDFAPSARR